MHITIQTTELKNILEVASRVTTKHITLPILQCVVLEVENNTLTIRSTNLEIGIEGNISVLSTEDGRVAVPAQILLQTISLIPQKDVTLFTEGDVLHIESHSSKTDIKTMEVADFPHIPHIDTQKLIMKGSLFALGIKTAAFTASVSSIKPELGSIYIFQKKEHTLTFVATDSFRLMEKTVSFKGVILTESLLIPYKNALEIARVAEAFDGDVTFFFTENQCALQAGNIYITSRLTSGTFPDYEQIIPKEYSVEAVLLTNDLSHALKKTNIFLNKFLQLTCTVSEGAVTFSSQNGESGATTESVKATTQGQDLRLNFNQRYMSEVIPHVTDDSVVLKCAGVGRPMVLENVHDRSFRYLIMPMNK